MSVALLGPAPGPTLWPRLMGLALRGAAHLQLRSQVAQAMMLPPQLANALIGDSAVAVLEAVEGGMMEGSNGLTARSEEEPPAKRNRTKKPLGCPLDAEAVVLIQKRLLEAINFSTVIGATPTEGEGGWTLAGLVKGLDDQVWRWSAASDTLQPTGDGALLSTKAWSFTARALRQMTSLDETTRDQALALTGRLISRVNDDAPTDAELKTALAMVFARLQYAPQLHTFLDGMCGSSKSTLLRDTAEAALTIMNDGAAEAHGHETPAGRKWNCHERTASAIEALIPNFRGLRDHFAKPAPSTPGNSAPSASPVEQDPYLETAVTVGGP